MSFCDHATNEVTVLDQLHPLPPGQDGLAILSPEFGWPVYFVEAPPKLPCISRCVEELPSRFVEPRLDKKTEVIERPPPRVLKIALRPRIVTPTRWALLPKRKYHRATAKQCLSIAASVSRFARRFSGVRM